MYVNEKYGRKPGSICLPYEGMVIESDVNYEILWTDLVPLLLGMSSSNCN